MNVKNEKLFKVILAIVIGIAGLLTIIFSIISLADGKSAEPSTALRYIAGAVLCVVGVAIAVVALSRENIKSNVTDLVLGGVAIGFGIFFFLKAATNFLDILICGIVPTIIASIGATLLFKGVLGLTKKEATDKCVVLIIMSVVMIVGGVLFVVFMKKSDNLYKVVWLLIGIAILALSVYYVVATAKNTNRKR